MGLNDDLKALSNRISAIEELIAPVFSKLADELKQDITDPVKRAAALQKVERYCDLAELVPFGPLAALAQKIEGYAKIAEELTQKEIAAQQAQSRADVPPQLPAGQSVESLLSGGRASS